ncbi:rust resistance kinase Lr10-like protein [Cinnamomum micranthum f. kanehirae]|uniref:Rust resistance kinase Lr10-like protein n=1 Tax=Cinnamomum micranthum f. kanehirae TaxID=337451 RepID=A0A3S3MWD3_9MAGN|nr:rust resistance kinase Lr10-like protein [Cinnamomum micranthum f. kanehirae]
MKRRGMGSFHIFHFLSLLLLGSVGAGFCGGDSCKPLHCPHGGPVVQFPFRIKERHPPHCGYPGFDISCQDKNTLVRIQSMNRDLVVVDIDYTEQIIMMLPKPKDCIWLPFLNNLNLSASPFLFYRDFTFISCSKNVEFSRDYALPCLSDVEQDIFPLRADAPVGSMPVSCRPIKTVLMPDLDRIYFDRPQNDYEEPVYLLSLRWDVPSCKECRWRGMECGFKNESSSDICCHPPRHDKGLKEKYGIIGAGASVGTLLLLITVVTSIKVYHSRKLNRKLDVENEIEVEKFLEGYKSLRPKRYSYADLKKITDQFKDKVGQGGYGSVFKGKLPNGTIVAVKILKNFGGDGGEFINEVGTIGRIHHVNVVRLLGFCADRLKRALIYEFMPNESLEKFIFSKNTHNHFLTWEKLQGIAIGIARGIEYLHQGCEQRILHFDIKPNNILLDQNFSPKISDFGLAKLCSKGKSVVSMTAARGTKGYIAPEVYSRNFGNVSSKSDVYSFGMLLLEMVGGRKNTDTTVESTSQVYFPEWIYMRLCQGEDMGLSFASNEDNKIAKKLTIVALWCIQWYPADRPFMKTVVLMLEGKTETLTMPPNPFASTTSANTNFENTHIANLSTISE